MSQPTLISYQIRDLAPVGSDDVLPSDARLRCFWENQQNNGIATQIIGKDLNVFCTHGSFVWDVDTQQVNFTPGFSSVVVIEAIWDPVNIRIGLSYNGEPAGQISGTPSQPINKPLTGLITLPLTIAMSDGSPTVILPYQTLVSVQGFPSDPTILTWGDWVSHGAYIFPMTVRLDTPNVLELPNHLVVVAQYGTVAVPDDLVVVNDTDGCGNKQYALPFRDLSPVSFYGFAQYQHSQYVTLVLPTDPQDPVFSNSVC